jgi:hypothetical protein
LFFAGKAMNASLTSALAIGVSSAGIFLLVAALGLGFFFMFLPTLPLFYAGLSARLRECWIASLMASVLVGGFAGMEAAMMYLLLLALPSWYWCKQALLYAGDGASRHWFPMGLAALHVTLFGCAAVAVITLHYMGSEGGIVGLIAEAAKKEFSQIESEYSVNLDVMIQHWAFLIFAMSIWMWVLLLYAHAWAANRLLSTRQAILRPSVAITPFAMPNWVLTLLAISALASLIGSPSMAFLGKTVLMSLMLPYFLQGMALMHDMVRAWPNRRFFLFFLYFMIFSLLWVALVLAAVGLVHHIKRLSAAPTSSKS